MGLEVLDEFYPGILNIGWIGHAEILVVTGERNIGKTTFCRQTADALKKAGYRVGGLLSPGRFDGDEKTGFFALNLETGESHLLASRIPGECEGTHLGPWIFDDQVLGWGNRFLQAAAPLDFLFIDELAYLEFNLNTGWKAAFPILQAQNYRLAIVVIRSECIASFSTLGFRFRVYDLPKNKP